MHKKSHLTAFFSWQSDISDSKHIIKDSIKAACQVLKEKTGYIVSIDEATRNLPGAPQIDNIILNKIAECDFFICDITPIVTHRGKHYPNSNVMYELGYAMKVLGDERIILLAKDDGNLKENQLPFDINHRRIGKFKNLTDCNLNYEIESCAKYSAVNNKKTSTPFISLSQVFEAFQSLSHKSTKEKKIEDINAGLLKATEESTVFFERRIASTFSGDRGLKVYTGKKEIARLLCKLLEPPIQFIKGLERADTDPIWWFRSGSTESISHCEYLGHRRILINSNEVVIKRIAVFRDKARYYGQYIYVEVEPDKPSGLYPINPEHKKECIRDSGYYDEEFALFKPKWYLPTFKFTRHEYDDGHARRLGLFIKFDGEAQLRNRYLSPYNFIIAAKFSPFNCQEFDTNSEEYFNKMLTDEISLEEFNNFMKQFPKRPW